MKITGVVITSLLATTATAFDKYLRTSPFSAQPFPYNTRMQADTAKLGASATTPVSTSIRAFPTTQP